MKACNCRICRENLTDLVNGLYQRGISKDSILGILKNSHNLSTNKSVLTRHLNNAGIVISETPLEEEEVVINNSAVKVFSHVDLNEISLSKYNFEETSPESIIEYIQKIHLAIYLQQLEIVCTQQRAYYLGETDIEPTQSIINLERIYKILNSTTGIEMTVNQKKAIETVEAMGYTLTTKLLEFN